MKKKIISSKYLFVIALTCFTFMLLFFEKPMVALADNQTATNVSELQQIMIGNMTDREAEFTIHYQGDLNPLYSDTQKFLLQIVNADDYLKLAWKEMKYSYLNNSSGGLDITFSFTYHTTKDQENYIGLSTKKIISQIITPKMNDLSKEAAIQRWIVKNVKYDYSLQQNTAYTALHDKKTTCMGYAVLFNKMLQQAGIESTIIVGSYPEGYHSWNRVKIDSVWYFVDITSDWAIGAITPQNKSEKEMIDSGYVWDESQYAIDSESLRQL